MSRVRRFIRWFRTSTGEMMGKIQRGIHSMKTDQARIDDQSVKQMRISGRASIIGAGETSLSVAFPVVFTERPGFSFGYELGENQIPAAGNFPIVSAGVASWTRTEKIRGLYHYTGAVIVAVAQGNPNYMRLHWHMEGNAFQNPVNDLDSDDPLSQ